MSRRILTALLLSTAIGLPSAGVAGDPLSPRVEVSAKAGNKRSLLTTELWAPLAQRDDRVLYADLRLMGDNDQNREGNFGLGYREINPYTNTVIGFHGWYDQRRTENNSTFRQLTFGAESLGHIWDMRANGYIPLNNSRTVNPGTASNPYLAGTGIYYDINGLLVETPQYGVDGEIGYRIPVLQKQADAIRIYGGGYHFFRNDTDNVTGFRIRTEAQVNSAFSLGARYQYDEPRGSQGFLEATIRFPFGAKKLYQTEGLRSRLDESAERDVDIVTSAKVAPGQKGVAVVNEAGTQQRILYVDNEATSGGDGSKDNPFNTLADAQAALLDHDILYIDHGDGTTAGMDQGIVIDKANISLIGSGSDLSYAGHTLIAAGLAPVITNSEVYSDANLTGNAVTVTAGYGNVYIAGISVDGEQQGTGIRVFTPDGGSYDQIVIENNNIAYNTNHDPWQRGIRVSGVSSANSYADSVFIQKNLIDRINSTGNSPRNIEVHLITANQVSIRDNSLNNGPIATGGDTVIANLQIQRNVLISGAIAFSLNQSANIHADVSNNMINDGRITVTSQQQGKLTANIYNNYISYSGSSDVVNVTVNANTLADSALNLSFYNNVIMQNHPSFVPVYISQAGLGQLNVDFGGGSLGSIGQNSIQTTGTIRANIRGGYHLTAQNNWWGSAAGLLPANHVLANGSTIDASDHLVTDPAL